jgi:hypothetical protein
MLKPTTTTTYAVGALYGLTAVSIWAGCLVVCPAARNMDPRSASKNDPLIA